MQTLTPNEPTFLMRPFVAAHNAKKSKTDDDTIPRAELETLYRQAQKALNAALEGEKKALEGEEKAKKALKAVAPDVSRRASYSEPATQVSADSRSRSQPRSNSTPSERGNYGTGWPKGSGI